MSKTPVSILQEMMVRKGYTPVYELIHDGCGTHLGLFKYQVRAGSISAIGSGHSKKEAKHDAAKSALERIRQEEEKNNSLEQEDIGVESPYTNKIQENAVGQLQEVCSQNCIMMPEYKLIRDEGPPHCKQFTIMCQVNKFQEIGVGRTKKQAKQLAAFEMLNKLKPLLGEVPESIKSCDVSKPMPAEELEALAEKYKEVSVSYGQKSRLGMKIIDYTWELTDLSNNEEIKKLNKTNLDDIEDPQETLQKILDEIGAQAHFNAVQGRVTSIKGMELKKNEDPDLELKPTPAKRRKPDVPKYNTLLNVLTTPDFVVWGNSMESQDLSDKMAAKAALVYLQIMTKITPSRKELES